MKTFSDLRVGDKIFTIDYLTGIYTIQEIKDIKYEHHSGYKDIIIVTDPIIGECNRIFHFRSDFMRVCCRIKLYMSEIVISDEEYFLEELKIMEYEKDKWLKGWR